ncbi:hypothetical protein TNCV_673331 [Trichonephila clavipes]|uniref:Uncharacterized protein n=1 Tax=Trichonephila clavipes TaxID=2585209 RepID=A0A8X6WCW3_TRICX|nr:hypothetical protein TNCV_673331 [Trichonephila clavipes]
MQMTGFQMINDDEIVTSVQEESNPVDDETDENEDSNNKESSKDPSEILTRFLRIGSWQACHEFEPSTTKDPPCWGAMHVKSVESSNVLCGVVARRGGSSGVVLIT